MSTEGTVVLATETPVFRDGGDFLLCELQSGGRTWSFGIPWGSTEQAMERCGEVLDRHRRQSRNVRAFPRTG
jgi:hypothetical protein